MDDANSASGPMPNNKSQLRTVLPMIHESCQNNNTYETSGLHLPLYPVQRPLQWQGLVEETALPALTAAIGSLFMAGDVVTLEGTLGAGKTTFVKALCVSLGVTEHVSSPTFTLIQHYQASRFPICHVDAYRVDELPAGEADSKWYELDEVLALGQALVLVEWSAKLPEGMLVPSIRVRLSHDVDSENTPCRYFEIEAS